MSPGTSLPFSCRTTSLNWSVGNKVHTRKCIGVRYNGADETDRAVPRGRVIGKEEFMAKGNRAVRARVRFVAATWISLARSPRSSSLDIGNRNGTGEDWSHIRSKAMGDAELGRYISHWLGDS